MRYIQYLSACLLIPVLFGCQQQELDQADGIGSPVQFNVATSYEPETRTEFSGVLTGTTSVTERIDWTDGDVFRVNDGGAQSSDLTVSAHQDNGVQSVATVSGTSLVWENGSATFYALYPSPATSGVTASLSAAGVATGTIPSAQTVTLSGREYKADMTHSGYMCASATANAGTPVSLVFKPLMTAFRFQIYAMDGCAPTANLTSVTLSSASTSLAGNFTATIGANSTYTASVVGTGNNTVSANLGTGLLLSTSEPVTVTLLALPVQQSQLTLTLGFSDSSTRSIDLKNGSSWVSVQPGQKMYVDNLDVPGESRWNYFLGDLGEVELHGQNAVTSGLDFTVTSYRYNTLSPSVNEPVAWTVEYSTDGTNWHPTLAAAGIADRFSVSPTSGSGSVAGEPVSAQITRAHNGSDPAEYTSGNSVLDAETAAMQAKTIPANALEADGYYDLSKHAVYGSSFYGPATTQETANCYVIDRPGKYKFPAVWGNAIRNNGTNRKAYQPQYHENTSWIYNDNNHFMRTFQRHDSGHIKDPYIFANTGDVRSRCSVKVIWATGTNSSGNDIVSNIITPSGSSNSIKFEIKEEDIRPGNVLLGLWFDGGFFIWSWHIWITNQDLTPTDNFMDCNLGWTNSPTATTAKWADWDFYVKVKQAGSGLEKIYEVHQIGDGTEAGAERGNSLYYQWGRKDPFPVDWSAYYDHGYTITTNATPTSILKINNVDTDVTDRTQPANHEEAWGMRAGHAINKPYIIYQNAATHHWLAGTDNSALIGNLWDATLIPYDAGTVALDPVKSVYDPSPRGFVVPKTGVYSGFSTSSPSNYVTNEGWNFGTGTETVFFPLGGSLNESGTALTGGYVWSTTSDSHQDANLKYKSQAMEFNATTVSPATHHYKDELLPVRPVVQTRF